MPKRASKYSIFEINKKFSPLNQTNKMNIVCYQVKRNVNL